MIRKYYFLILCLVLILVSSNFCFSQYTPQQIYRLGLKAYYEANFQEAIKYFSEYIQLNSNDVTAYNFRGLSYQGLKNYQDALGDFTTIIAKSPNGEAYINRGYLYIRMEMYENAVNDFGNAIRYNPNEINGYTGRASAYIDLKNYNFALNDLSSALNLNPNAAEVLIIRGGVYLILNDTAKALEDIQKGLRSRDSIPILSTVNRGLVYLFMDDAVEMLKSYDKEVQLNPKSYMPYFKRGYMYYLLKRYSKAKDDLDKALELNGGFNKKLEEVINYIQKKIKLKE